MNVHPSRWEALWSSDEPIVVELCDAEAELEMLVHNLTDPVRQQLVDKVNNWPGVSSLRHQLSGKPFPAKRPEEFFRKRCIPQRPKPRPHHLPTKSAPIEGHWG